MTPDIQPPDKHSQHTGSHSANSNTTRRSRTKGVSNTPHKLQ